VLALDTFVRHSGGVSFGAEKPARVQQAQERLASLHPDYAPAVARYLHEDPAWAARLKVDQARIRAGGLPSVLFVSDVGGAGRHRRESADALAGLANVLLLRPGSADETVVEWLRAGEGLQLAFRLPGEHEALLQTLRALGVAHIHFHHALDPAVRVVELPQSLGVMHDFTVHDYFAVCPQITLTDDSGRYCGEFGAEQCAACLQHRPAPGGASIESWRAAHRRLLERARHVFAPSADTVARLRRYLPSISVVQVPRPAMEAAAAVPEPKPLAGARPLRIVTMGALSRIDGADTLEATAALAAQRGSRLEFHLLGRAYRELRDAPAATLTVHGEQAMRDLPGLLQALRPDVVWFPAQWPQPHSDLLGAALDARLPIVAPDLGCYPERLSSRLWTWICPWQRRPEEWVRFFETLAAGHFDTGCPPEPAPLRPTECPGFSLAHEYLRGIRRPALGETLSAEFLERHRPAGNS
jgi:hypothetical protein